MATNSQIIQRRRRRPPAPPAIHIKRLAHPMQQSEINGRGPHTHTRHAGHQAHRSSKTSAEHTTFRPASIAAAKSGASLQILRIRLIQAKDHMLRQTFCQLSTNPPPAFATPVGLFGLATNNRRVRSVTAANIASRS